MVLYLDTSALLKRDSGNDSNVWGEREILYVGTAGSKAMHCK